jgi:proteic killer suppression protein
MIRSFKSRPLADLFETGKSGKIDAKMHKRIRVRLDLNMPGYDFHALHGFKPTRYTIHVNGPWCITFEFDGRDALRVDFEQYH